MIEIPGLKVLEDREDNLNCENLTGYRDIYTKAKGLSFNYELWIPKRQVILLIFTELQPVASRLPKSVWDSRSALAQ